MIKVSYWTWMCQFTTLHISFNYTFLFCSRIWCHPVETYDQICNFNDRYDQQDYLTVRINLNDHYSLRSLCQAAFSFYVSWSCLSRLFFSLIFLSLLCPCLFYITSLNVPLMSFISLTWLWTIVQIQTQSWLILGRPLSNCWFATILSIKLRHMFDRKQIPLIFLHYLYSVIREHDFLPVM